MIDYEKIISPVVSALPPSGIRKFFDIVADIRLKKDRRTTPQMPDLWNCVKKSAITMTENSI